MTARNFVIDMDEKNFENAEAILSEIGLDLTAFLKISLMKLIKERRVPFELAANSPTLQIHEIRPISTSPTTPVEVVSPDVAFSRRSTRVTNKITREMRQSVWNEFKRRFSSGDRNSQDAAQTISHQTGMNRGSAFIYFTILNNLVDGMQNKRSMKYDDLEYFVQKIKAEFPEYVLKFTIVSLEASLPYWDEKIPGSFTDKVSRLVERLKSSF